MLRSTCSLCTPTSARLYSVASKQRRTKHISFPSSTTSSSQTTSPVSNTPSNASHSTPKHLIPQSSRSGTITLANGRRVRESPLVERAREKSVKQRNVFESYLVLNWKTRLYFWIIIGGTAVIGLYGGDYLFPETEEEKNAKGEKVVEPSTKVV